MKRKGVMERGKAGRKEGSNEKEGTDGKSQRGRKSGRKVGRKEGRKEGGVGR
jgi:hypothetical protein